MMMLVTRDSIRTVYTVHCTVYTVKITVRFTAE